MRYYRWHPDWSRYFRFYDRTKLRRLSADWITRTTTGYSFGYTDCYVVQHDKAPSLYTRLLRKHLIDTFPNRWIGRGSTINWPPRSPDLTALDFCLWGWMKSGVCRRKVDTRDELLDHIMDVIARKEQRQDALRRARCHILTLVAKCLDVDCGIFENLL
jgi:hypothetical protein